MKKPEESWGLLRNLEKSEGRQGILRNLQESLESEESRGTLWNSQAYLGTDGAWNNPKDPCGNLENPQDPCAEDPEGF